MIALMRNHFLFLTGVVMVLVAPAWAQQNDESRQRERQQIEEVENYFKKWLKEDVVYIISDEERDVFELLVTIEEKEQFIEQFWFRRDPDLRTPINEFKEEHYRRVAYANESFASGLPGWMTDRGRIYIIHGPPAEIEAKPTGGQYVRRDYEGGGTTSTYPFERWRYRHIDGIGSDIELEFIDPSNSNEYRLALLPEEKDALLMVPGAGLTRSEEMGITSKADRAYFSGTNTSYMRAKDNPFERYETYARVQGAPIVKYKDLKELVEINVSFEEIPFELEPEYFRLNDAQVLVTLNVQIRNRDLTFKLDASGRSVARLALYGIVTSLSNRVIEEFEDDLVTAYAAEALKTGLTHSSMYQRVLPLEARGRYKLDLAIKDLNNGHTGVVQKVLVPPNYGSDRLAASSLVLASLIQPIQDPMSKEMFVLGDVKVRPSMNREFDTDDGLGLYFQVYNAELDQTRLEPSLAVVFRLFRDGQMVREVSDLKGESTQFFNGQRIVLIQHMPTRGLTAGEYELRVEIEDEISQQTLELRTTLRLRSGEQKRYQLPASLSPPPVGAPLEALDTHLEIYLRLRPAANS